MVRDKCFRVSLVVNLVDCLQGSRLLVGPSVKVQVQ